MTEAVFEVTVTEYHEMEVTDDMRNLYDELHGADGDFSDYDVATWMYRNGYSEVVHESIGRVERA